MTLSSWCYYMALSLIENTSLTWTTERVHLLLLLHPFNSLFSTTTWVSRHQKGKPFCILLEKEMMGWQWHQLDHMQIMCTSLQRENHASISPLSFYRPDALPAAQPTASKHCVHLLHPALLAEVSFLLPFVCQFLAGQVKNYGWIFDTILVKSMLWTRNDLNKCWQRRCYDRQW